MKIKRYLFLLLLYSEITEIKVNEIGNEYTFTLIFALVFVYLKNILKIKITLSKITAA